MKKLLVLLCASLMLILSACGANSDPSQTQKDPEWLLGETEGSSYVNKVVGFSASIPEGWSVASMRQISSLSAVPEDYLSRATSLEPDSQLFIFFCTKYAYGYVGQNPCIGITVSNQDALKPLLTDQKALDNYVEQNRASIEQQYKDTEATLSSEMGVQIGGYEYSVIHISANYNDTLLKQEMYILGVNDYILMITETYTDEADKAAADTFLETLKIN